MAVQVPIPFVFHADQNFDTYYTGPNSEIIQALKSCSEDVGEKFIVLWGSAGLGKSHLLQATCQFAHRLQQRLFYLPLNDLLEYGPKVLDGLEQYQLICIDDIHTLAGISAWETGFFHFFNRHRDLGRRLILSTDCAPSTLPIKLTDLATRLTWGLTLQLHPLSDQDKQHALTLRARTLGLDLSPRVGQFLLNHTPRDLPSVWKLLEELDHATLAAKRKLTIPFLKSFLDGRA